MGLVTFCLESEPNFSPFLNSARTNFGSFIYYLFKNPPKNAKKKNRKFMAKERNNREKNNKGPFYKSLLYGGGGDTTCAQFVCSPLHTCRSFPKDPERCSPGVMVVVVLIFFLLLFTPLALQFRVVVSSPSEYKTFTPASRNYSKPNDPEYGSNGV